MSLRVKQATSTRSFFDSVATRHRIQKQQDWYTLSPSARNSIYASWKKQPNELKTKTWNLQSQLESAYPEFCWYPWLSRTSLPPSHWKNISNRRQFFDWFAEEHNIYQQEEWYSVSQRKVVASGGSGVLLNFDSVISALEATYPEFSWKSTLDTSSEETTTTSPQRETKRSLASEIQLMNWIASKLNIKRQEDWYEVTEKDIIDRGGRDLLKKGSLVFLLKRFYPQFDWFECQWNSSRSSLREIADWIAYQLEVNTQEEWYSITRRDVLRVGGSRLFSNTTSMLDALKSCYPEFDWESHLFIHSVENPTTRTFFDWLAKQLGIETYSDWYKIDHKDISYHTGRKLFKKNSYEIIKALKRCYPEFDWLPWMLPELPIGFWSLASNQRNYLDWLGEQLGIEHLDQWTQVQRSTVISIGGKNAQRLLANNMGSWIQTLKTCYPQHDWPQALHSSSGQSHVTSLLKFIFPNRDILMNHKLKPSVELDIFIPSLSLAIEYQGEQHYEASFGMSSAAAELQSERDRSKVEICKSFGITLIAVPYWWQITKSSLIHQIRAVRPDITISDDTNTNFYITESAPQPTEDIIKPVFTVSTDELLVTKREDLITSETVEESKADEETTLVSAEENFTFVIDDKPASVHEAREETQEAVTPTATDVNVTEPESIAQEKALTSASEEKPNEEPCLTTTESSNEKVMDQTVVGEQKVENTSEQEEVTFIMMKLELNSDQDPKYPVSKWRRGVLHMII